MHTGTHQVFHSSQDAFSCCEASSQGSSCPQEEAQDPNGRTKERFISKERVRKSSGSGLEDALYLWKEGRGILAAALLNALTRAAISASCCRSQACSCSRHVMPAQFSVPPSAYTSAIPMALGCKRATTLFLPTWTVWTCAPCR